MKEINFCRKCNWFKGN